MLKLVLDSSVLISLMGQKDKFTPEFENFWFHHCFDRKNKSSHTFNLEQETPPPQKKHYLQSPNPNPIPTKTSGNKLTIPERQLK